jgi:hypothetical protein
VLQADPRDVAPDDSALRRVRPLHVVKDPKAPGGRRASSAAFEDDLDGSPMSAYLKSLVVDLGLVDDDVVHGKESGWGVASTPVQTLIDEEQVVAPDPILNSVEPHPCDRAHALVRGEKRPKGR